MALYSIGYIARYYGVSPSTIRRWEASGKIPASIRTIGGHRRFEQTGEISLRGLLQVGFALNCLDEFNVLFAQKQYQLLDDVLNEQSINRKRGKKNE